MPVDDTFHDLERRLEVLEATHKKDIALIEVRLDERFKVMERMLSDLKKDIKELKEDFEELRETVIKSGAKYNGYADRFVSRREFEGLKSRVKAIEAQDVGVSRFLERAGIILSIVMALVALIHALGAG